ncbi:MAG: DUF2934 domain-containing protein [Candidatus Eisenbacteria bacterium]|uniref:DUF2934 domain-containing protein n=1 Tax=Eiseniibacteriota bacterium TaxID=2212470 RepID=A0A933S9X1_UNCEI|nr:DUF2934 domain-containing protein [Candidatus Eisenbacteria bacterium]
MEKRPKAAPRAKAAASPAKKTTTPKTAASPRKRTAAVKTAAAPAATKPVSAPSSPAFAPSHGQIAAFAYSLFEQSGHQHGRALEHWLEAESRLKQGLKL